MFGENRLSRRWFQFLVNETWGRGYFSCIKAGHHESQTAPDGTPMDLIGFLCVFWLLLPWAENRLSSCGFRFPVDGSWGREYGKSFNHFLEESKPFQMELWLIYSHSHLDYLCFYIGRRAVCPGVNFDSKWMEPDIEGISSVSKQFLIKSKRFMMELWQIYSDSLLDFQCLSIGGRKTLSCGWTPRQG